MPERPFVLLGQQYVADPTRSRDGVNPVYAYAHVPAGYTGDATEAVVAQVERFAPGFRDRIVATTVATPADLARDNPNQVGGDIIGGANAGQTCTTHEDCPGSICPSYSLLDPEDMCSGVDGSYVILSEEGSFTDPNFNADTERAATLMRVDLDDDGHVTAREIIDRPTEETTNMACDGLPPGAGGRIFMAEYFNVDLASCFRTEKERLTSVRKASGVKQVLLDRLDSVQGIDDCNDIEDTSAALASSR